MKSKVVRMVTRREVLGAGVALASVSGAIGLGSANRVSAVTDQAGLPKVGAMVLDESLSVSSSVADVLHRRQHGLCLLTIGLDASRSIELKQLFNKSQIIAGLSSGATLFCLERIAWDYGYRVTRRSEYEFNANAADALANDATVLALADKLFSSQPAFFAAALAPSNRTYRPSMADDTLHAWIMQPAVTSKNRTVCPEIR
jgi:hypothetical protein